MTRKSGLGKGLDALIPPVEVSPREEVPATGGVFNIPVGFIDRNPRQPRSRFDDDELAELAVSIREHGILQPLLVTYDTQKGRFTLIAGERRLLAARLAELESVPAIVRDASAQEQVELALIENVQRADLSPLETAEAYRQLVEDFGLPHEDIAWRVGKNRVTITNTLRLLRLPDDVRQALAENHISEGHARALLALPAPQAQSAALQTIMKKELNVRQTEELVRLLSGRRSSRPPKSPPAPEIIALEERLRQRLGTKVTLNHRRKGGTLVIHYYSEEELESLVTQILGDHS